MKRIFQKLKSNKGETLVETLFAILIFTFASVTMYSMVTSAMAINNKAKAADELNQSQLVIAERAEGDGRSASVTLTLTETPVGTVEQNMGQVAVEVYGEDGALYAYYVDAESAEGGA